MPRRPVVTERNALAIKAWLDRHGPFVGNQEQLAARVGITRDHVVDALSWIRKPRNVAANGWTIPFQKAGRGVHVYDVVDNAAMFTAGDEDHVTTSTHGRRETIYTWLTRTVAQEELAALATSGAEQAEHQRLAAVLNGAAAMVSV